MADVRRDAVLAGADSNEAFQTSLKVLQETGFELWKTRPLGWFAIARRRQQGAVLEANISVRGGGPTHVSLGLSSDNLAETVLADIAADLLRRISAHLGQEAL